MLCDNIDDETLRVVLHIQLEDLESIKRSSKGKNRPDEISDADLAVETYESELKSHTLLASDRCMCKSIARANKLDGRLVSILVNQEKQAAQDREVALRFDRGEQVNEGPSTDHTKQESSTDVDEDLLSKLESLYVSTDGFDDILGQAESSTWAASRGQATDTARLAKREKRQCNSCFSNYFSTDIARCPCSHEYCRDCLHTLFETSLTDESLFPPRCCKRPIPVDDYRHFLPSKLIGEFQAKAIELSTPNRTYCHRSTCSTFIPKEFIEADIAVCQRCEYRTCVMCKGSEHKNQDCAQDTLTQDLLQFAAANGWQRCFSCRRIVELEVGCNHMTCRCGAQFCYSCGYQWKTCACDQWNEERLYARANALVDREPDAHFMNPEGRARQVEREAQNLVINHQCTHNTWRSRSGAHRCEECHDRLPLFIYECARCRIRACRRCRFNRL
ncbi:IBR finger domain-containing protein [Colletotrichum cereale]|nr:IBR finger domain-containing protein [Colletotrichum cereale]